MTERVLEFVDALPDLPPRPGDAHKGTFGRVLIVAGSRGMTGAAGLAGAAALRGGAGLVTVATPLSIQPIVAGYEPSYLTIGLPDDNEGLLSRAALPQVMDVLSRQTAAAWGPGLGRSDDLDDVTLTVYKSAALPMVFDADGLNALAHRRDWMSGPPPAGPRVLTPHPGEFARLTGLEPGAIAARRAETAADFAAQHGVVVVLKGPQTVITDGHRVALNPTGNSGMATGGTGDVLTGLIAALLGQQMEPFDAAQLAADLHGLAGDLAAAELSNPGLIASDLPKYLACAWRHVGR
jgi:NAD(P)H-hydrate epimerase